MNSTGIRRILLLIAIVLWFASFLLFKKTKINAEPVEPGLVYKVRAYVVTPQEAEKIQNEASTLGYSGSIEKGNHTIRKFMGYVVEQSFSATDDTEKVDFVNEFLQEKGYESQVIPGPDGETLTIRAGGIFTDEAEAQKTAEAVKELTKVTFNVEKFFKDTTYKAFVVVFQGIPDKPEALTLKDKISEITSEVEVISY